jgi:hypothetical protein
MYEGSMKSAMYLILVSLIGIAVNTYLLKKAKRFNADPHRIFPMSYTHVMMGYYWSALGLLWGILGLLCFR